MKKTILSTIALTLAINMFAITYNQKVTITLYDGTYYPNLIVGESDDVPAGSLLSGYYAPVNDLASKPLSVYVNYESETYENIILHSLTNISMGIKTSNATSYSLYFAGTEGSEVLIYDVVTDSTIHVNSVNPYAFTITDGEKNGYINNRFYINYVPKPEICHRYKLLQITDCVGMTVKVLNMDGTATSIADTNITSAYQEINLAGLATGQYKVEWNSQTLVITVQ